MSVHLLKGSVGKCLAYGAIYGPVVAAKRPGQVGVDDKGVLVMGEVDAVEDRNPGSYFEDALAWSLHHDRCDVSRVAVGSIESVKFVPADSDEDPHHERDVETESWLNH